MVGLLTTREKFDCSIMLGSSREAHFYIVNCPEKCKAFSCVYIPDSFEKLLY